MTKEEFEKIISDALADFSAYFLEKMKNVAIVVQDEPDEFQKKQLGYSSGNCILGLYEGVPQIKRYNYNRVAPDKITFFQNNVERTANNNIKQLIKETLWHEIGHHFGMTEEEIQRYKKN
jgi:predicted Zn-dependent protease with MMP-like domain